MYRTALWLLFAFLVLGAIGWWSSDFAWQEWLRLIAVACMSLGMLLLVIDYATAPQPPGESKP